MTNKTTFIKAVKELVQEYIDNWDRFDENPQIRVNPELLFVEAVDGKAMLEDLGDSEEAFEDAAYAQGDETMSATDFQEKQDPDFYPIKDLIKPVGHNLSVPDDEKIEAIATRYF